jgi:hypothetical protein
MQIICSSRHDGTRGEVLPIYEHAEVECRDALSTKGVDAHDFPIVDVYYFPIFKAETIAAPHGSAMRLYN